jgi:hypothetical protein
MDAMLLDLHTGRIVTASQHAAALKAASMGLPVGDIMGGTVRIERG